MHRFMLNSHIRLRYKPAFEANISDYAHFSPRSLTAILVYFIVLVLNYDHYLTMLGLLTD